MTRHALLIDNSVNVASTDKTRWDERYRIGHHPPRDQVNTWIIDHRHYLAGGMALDLACACAGGRESVCPAGAAEQAVDPPLALSCRTGWL